MSDQQAVLSYDPSWGCRSPLSRLFLATRKARGLRLEILVGQITPDGPNATAAQLLAFENGGMISVELFERLVAALDVEHTTVRRLITDRRREDERRFETEFLRLPNRLVIPYRPVVGYQRILPATVAHGEAHGLASDLARWRQCPVNLYLDHRFLFRFERSGALVRSRELVGWSRYPFDDRLSMEPVQDGWSE